MNLVRKLDIRPSMDGRNRYRYGLFSCDYCGSVVEKLFYTGLSQRSCGCVNNEFNVKHGHFRNGKSSRIAEVWHGMKDRCNNPRNKKYPRYGGRGISICEEWLSDPAKFFSWALSNGWDESLQIDRINNDLGYSPDNCRFVTSAGNGRNRSSTRLSLPIAREIRAEFSMGNVSIRSLAKRYGVGDATVADVLKNRTWIEKEVI